MMGRGEVGKQATSNASKTLADVAVKTVVRTFGCAAGCWQAQ